ncbi:hypothetical protein FRACYDRAFT_268057 [Fragilariopsis cylindrus CCMP1102]|uniref:Uncharacterized protein n=1 Tax=Fragilariopsis cylindrus CCMP1102 TaxID=635003 RepID=A0A1E7FN97_9STRA|nr:hypothetical protein FRACYDRAFT_268057 [Fragilariopsis cylindrus CCMP1102]|eukprot:OEU19641.1 hypothetical protein FRACYDRAFT_268057 [Fragilariopsis cylindrus CCMP1102]
MIVFDTDLVLVPPKTTISLVSLKKQAAAYDRLQLPLARVSLHNRNLNITKHHDKLFI